MSQSISPLQKLSMLPGYFFVLPSNVMDDIDKLNVDLNAAADTLSETTNKNSVKIRRVFNEVPQALFVVAGVMLILALTGLVLSLIGYQHAILVFVITGWLLVATTFILCGVFMILNNGISDTCMAMGEWVENPHRELLLVMSLHVLIREPQTKP